MPSTVRVTKKERCSVCNKPGRLVSDYDPLTKQTRDKVCVRCYRVLIAFKHDEKIIERVVAYMEGKL